MNLNQRIDNQTINGTAYYVYTDGDGTKKYFKQVPNTSTYEDELKLGLTLIRDVTTGAFVLKDKQDNNLHFTSDGKLFVIEDKNGNRQVLSYNPVGELEKVTDPSDREVVFFFSQGKLEKMRDPAGRFIVYEYSNDRLTSITYPDGKKSIYSY